MKSHSILTLIVLAGTWRTSVGANPHLEFQPDDSQSILEHECVNVTLRQSENVTQTVEVEIESLNPEIAAVTPTSLTEHSIWSRPIEICGISGGLTRINASIRDDERLSVGGVSAYISVLVLKSQLLQAISDIFGWIYIISWSVAPYPQIYLNYKRRSVVGLSFDMVALMYMTNILYMFYNLGLYFSTTIQNEYFRSNPGGTIPVVLTDVVVSVYENLGYIYVVYQCVRYEHSTQRVSSTTKYSIILIVLSVLIAALLASKSKIEWLDVLTYCSDIKLVITVIKSFPQAIENYRRKSTEAYSVLVVKLNFIGGVLCMLQMIINGYNYNDWYSLVGNFAKFSIALSIVAFSVLFLYQHYVLYRNPYQEC